MNIIADRLFALLLGWTRSLFNSIWNLVTDNSGGFLGFLQRFWLPLIILLVVFGTLVDYIIWLVRWRPYYVWSAWLRKRLGQRRMNQTRYYMEDLDHSPLDLPEFREGQGEWQPQLMDEPIYFDFQTPWQEQAEEPLPQDQLFAPSQYQPALDAPLYAYPQMEPYGQVEPPVPDQPQQDPPPLFVPALPWENLRQVPVMPLPQQDEFAPPIEMGQPQPAAPDVAAWPPKDVKPLYVPPVEPWQAAPPPQPRETAPQPAQRRRRVETKHQRSGNVLRSLKDTFFVSDDDREPIDSIQPPVAQEDAFHKPYYPQNYTYREQPPAQAPQEGDTP